MARAQGGRPRTLSDLTPDPRNANKGTDRGAAMVSDSIADCGAGRSILLDKRGQIIAGNKTRDAALRQGLTLRVIQTDGRELVAVQRTDLDLTDPTGKARRLAFFDNRTSEVGLAWDAEELMRAQGDGLDLGTFFDEKELARLISRADAVSGNTDPDDAPETRRTSIKHGHLFELGRHRLLCGDSTVREDVERVIAGRSVAACITDPPYSVNYDRSQAARGGSHGAHDAYTEAAIDPTDLLRFMLFVPGDVLVMSYPVDRHFFALASSFLEAGFEVRKELVWVKDQFSFWPGAKYQQRHEPILVCARKGRPLNADVPANQSTVFEFPRPRAHALHATQKPIELWALLVTYHVPEGQAVYEPFAGSGTTVIAAEQLGRTCCAIEKAPEYCQVVIDRWESFTGQKAKKVAS